MENHKTCNSKYLKNLVNSTNKLLPLNYKKHHKNLPLSLITGANSFFVKTNLNKISANYLDNGTKLKENRKRNSNIKTGNNSTNHNYNISSNNVTNSSTINNNLNLISINEYKKKQKTSPNNIPILTNNNSLNIFNKYLNIKFVTGRNLKQNSLHTKANTNINSSNQIFIISYGQPIKTYKLAKLLAKTRKFSHTKTLIEKREQIKKPKSFLNNINNSHKNTQSEGNMCINLNKLIDNPFNNLYSDIMKKNKIISKKVKEVILNKKNKSVSIKKCKDIKNNNDNNNTKNAKNIIKTKSFNFINEKKSDSNNLSTSKLFLKKHKSTRNIEVQIKNCINTSRNTTKKNNSTKKNELILKKIRKIPTNSTKLNIKNNKIIEGDIEDILYNDENNYSGKIDAFDDLNSIIKKIKFEKTNMKNLDIFSVDETDKNPLSLRDVYNNEFEFIFKRCINNKNNYTYVNKNRRNCCSFIERKSTIKFNPFYKNN